jgi:multisubunit Na+/H+ antiporter MnhG subunit
MKKIALMIWLVFIGLLVAFGTFVALIDLPALFPNVHLPFIVVYGLTLLILALTIKMHFHEGYKMSNRPTKQNEPTRQP